MSNNTNIDPHYKPLTAWNYFWLEILFSIPIVGFVFLIVFSFSPANINRRSFARSYFCSFIVVAVIIAILFATGLLGTMLTYLSSAATGS